MRQTRRTDINTADQPAPDDWRSKFDAPNAPDAELPGVGKIRHLRVWPAVVSLIGLWVGKLVPPLVARDNPMSFMVAVFAPLVFGLLILIWWLFFSRAGVRERWIGLLGLILIGILTVLLSDKSVRVLGTIMMAIPWGITAFTVALVLLRSGFNRRRVGFALLAALCGFGFWCLVRTDTIYADFRSNRSWRWEPTVEDQFMEQLADQASSTDDAAEPLGEPEWSEFRGPRRDGVQPGIELDEDWSVHPPQEIWRINAGPGWSSFSVAGKRLFTQEQRGDNEAVVCYDAETGQQRWVHEYPSRFWEVVGGAGPRATPTLHDDRLFALGAEGWLMRLDPLTGTEVWSRDTRTDSKREPPTWGFSASPLVVGGVVIVYGGGTGDRGLLAYDTESGELRWSAPAGDHSYSSAQLSEIDGRTLVLMLTNTGLTFVDPNDGSLIGEYDWDFKNGYRVVQPMIVDGSSVLVGTGLGMGTRRIAPSFEDDTLVFEEDWTTTSMKPYFNDYVAHQGHLYGFDHNIFASIDLETGERNWKKGRYGNGQVLLLPDADQLVVLSEDGELVLLRATPESHQELARFSVLDTRTWNHPVLVGNRIYVRNNEEAACFELATISQNVQDPPVDTE